MVNMLFGTRLVRRGTDGLWVLKTTWVQAWLPSIPKMMQIVPMSLDMTGCTTM